MSSCSEELLKIHKKTPQQQCVRNKLVNHGKNHGTTGRLLQLNYYRDEEDVFTEDEDSEELAN